MIEEVSRNEMLSTIHYMTEHFPYRLAGSPCEAAASRYVTERLKQYGLEVENKEFYTYNSDPMYSKVTVLEPEMEIDSLPCAHIRATKPEGEIFELIYVGNGDYAAYKDIDVTGKMVLVEVSYAPPVPEKARIAYEMGAAGIMCMNWGNDEEVICRRGLKGVWGNPTEANFHCIPEIVGVGVTRGAGLKLKQLCLEGRKVEVKVTAIADRTWSIERIAKMKPAAPDFLLMWDNAYCIHEFDGEFVPFKDILSECEKYGNADMVFEFASTSKVTLPGAGIACFACSEANMEYMTKLIGIQAISFDKMNQLRHVKFLQNKEHTLALMKEHAKIMKPKFDMVVETLEREIAPLGIASWHTPKGGYFVSVNTAPGLAKRTLALAKEAGVVMTSAGATYPYGHDPLDSNIRVAPSLPPVEELEQAMAVFCCCLKLAALEQVYKF